jgi:polyhydroxyalkanoate synthesis regulator phasin
MDPEQEPQVVPKHPYSVLAEESRKYAQRIEDSNEFFKAAGLKSPYESVDKSIPAPVMKNAQDELFRSMAEDDDNKWLTSAGEFVKAAGVGTARGILTLGAAANSAAMVAQQKITGGDAKWGMFAKRAMFLKAISDDYLMTEAARDGGEQVQAIKEKRKQSGLSTALSDLLVKFAPAEYKAAAAVYGSVGDDIIETIGAMSQVVGDDPVAGMAYGGDLIGSNTPQMAASMGITSVAGPQAGFAFNAALSSALLLDEASTDPVTGLKRDVSNKALAMSLAAGTVSGFVETLGNKELLKAAARIANAAPVTGAAKVAIKDALQKTLLESVEGTGKESITEIVQTVIENVGAKYGFDPDRVLSQGVGESAVVGAIMGGGIPAGVGVYKINNLLQAKAQERADARKGGVADRAFEAMDTADAQEATVSEAETDQSQKLPTPVYLFQIDANGNVAQTRVAKTVEEATAKYAIDPEEVASARESIASTPDEEIISLVENEESLADYPFDHPLRMILDDRYSEIVANKAKNSAGKDLEVMPDETPAGEKKQVTQEELRTQQAPDAELFGTGEAGRGKSPQALANDDAVKSVENELANFKEGSKIALDELRSRAATMVESGEITQEQADKIVAKQESENKAFQTTLEKKVLSTKQEKVATKGEADMFDAPTAVPDESKKVQTGVNVPEVTRIVQTFSVDQLIETARDEDVDPVVLQVTKDEAARRGIDLGIPAKPRPKPTARQKKGAPDPEAQQPMTMAEFNRLSPAKVRAEARKRGITEFDTAHPKILARQMVADVNSGVVFEEGMTEEAYFDAVSTQSENIHEIMDAILGADIIDGPARSTPEFILLEHFGRKTKYQDANGNVVLDYPKINRDAARGEFLDSSRYITSSGGMTEDQYVMAANEALDGIATVTFDDLVQFANEHDKPGARYKEMKNGAMNTALRQRFTEVRGSNLTKVELEAYQANLESESVVDSQLFPDIDQRTTEFLAKATGNENYASGSFLDMSPDQMDVLADYLYDIEGSFNPTLDEIVTDLNITKQEARQISNELRKIQFDPFGGSSPTSDAPAQTVGPVPTQDATRDSEGEARRKATDGEDPIVLYLSGFDINLPESLKILLENAGTHLNYANVKEKTVKALKYAALPQGNQDLRFFNIQNDKNSRAMSHIKDAQLRLRDLFQAYDEVNGGFGKETNDQLRELRRFMRGDKNADLPPSVLEVAKVLRSKIDIMSKSLIESGAAMDDLALIIEKNDGVYMTRTFKTLLSDSWAKELKTREKAGDVEAVRILTTARANIGAKIRSSDTRIKTDLEYMEVMGVKRVTNKMRSDLFYQSLYADNYASAIVGSDLIEREVDKYLFRDRKDSGGSSSKLAKNLGIFKKRGEFTHWELELMGEQTDPRANFLATIVKQASLLETHRMLTTMRDQLSDISGNENPIFISEEGMRGRETGIPMIKISAEGNEKMAPLAGYSIPRELHNVLEDMFAVAEPMKGFARFVVGATGAVKAGKVIYSAQSQIRNFFSASLFVMSQGYVPTPKPLYKAMKLAFNYGVAAKKGKLGGEIEFAGQKVDARELMLDMTRRGLLNESAMGADIQKALAKAGIDNFVDAVFLSPEKQRVGGALGFALDTMIKKPEQFYLFGDNVWKIVLYEKELSSLMRIYPADARTEEGMERLRVEASQIVRNNSPTYSLGSPLAKDLAESQLIAPFVMFAYESSRTFVNTIGRARYEYQEGQRTENNELASRGITRFASALLASRGPAMLWGGALAPAIAAVLGGGYGDDERDKAALREVVPEFSRNTDLAPLVIHNRNGETGALYIDVGFMNPYSALADPAMIAYRDISNREFSEKDFASSVAEVAFKALEPYTDMELFVPTVLRAFTGRTASGADIWNKSDTPINVSGKVGAYLLKELAPGIAVQAMNIANPKKNRWIELTSTISGHRISFVPFVKSMEYTKMDLSDGLKDSTTDLMKVVTKKGVTQNEIDKAIIGANEARKTAFATAFVKAKAIERLSRSTLNGVLDDGKFPKESKSALARTKWLPYSNFDALDDRIKKATNRDEADYLRENKAMLRQSLLKIGTGDLDIPPKLRPIQ